jgi:hypothetical protein
MVERHEEIETTREEDKALVASMPWVARYEGGVDPVTGSRYPCRDLGPCTEYLSGVPVKAYYGSDEDRSNPKYRCKGRALWILVRPDGQIKTMCWTHLCVALSSMQEEERTPRWVIKHWNTLLDLMRASVANPSTVTTAAMPVYPETRGTA